MDPTKTAELLGTGSPQIILAVVSVVLALALAAVATWLGKALYAEMKACNATLLSVTEKKIESDNKLADAIDGSTRVSEAMLAQLRKP